MLTLLWAMPSAHAQVAANGSTTPTEPATPPAAGRKTVSGVAPKEKTPTESFTFKSGVSNVRVDVQALDGYRLIKDLNKEDFVVSDLGQPQPILYFDRGDEPISVLLLLDISGSMEKYIQQVAGVAQQALKFLKPRDRIGVMIFARSTKVTLPFTSEFAGVEDAIRNSVKDETVGSATEMNVAIEAGAKYLDESGETGRRAILILTDSKGLSYRLNDRQVIYRLYEADTVLNALVVGRAERPAPPREGANPDYTAFDVFHIAEETGGEWVKADRANLEFPQLMERIRMRYGLQYKAPEGRSGQFRRLNVELTPAAKARYPNAELKFRKGYIVK